MATKRKVAKKRSAVKKAAARKKTSKKVALKRATVKKSPVKRKGAPKKKAAKKKTAKKAAAKRTSVALQRKLSGKTLKVGKVTFGRVSRHDLVFAPPVVDPLTSITFHDHPPKMPENPEVFNRNVRNVRNFKRQR
jgi:hypothetical protein